jgi:hypothetical protein
MPRPPDIVPPANERALMTAKLVALGMRGTDLASIIAPGRTRRQIGQDLIVLLRNSPKKK